ncbi:hypothetical protein [uncultured Roseivirga sp.]|uniref:hypothetical protein n=1 Tax=uncultured Roseivirga sp. TaxID=543088 RepID=UPI0025845219|nr:hypothetical protein [uncultured Roseivirga sp.]|tara:strand:- start:2191 stop:3075 length:885 start_codon:yes stop_codon:yes gene_type:complete
MSRLLVLTLFFVGSIQLLAQSKSYVLADKKTKEPITYATVKADNNFFTYTDEKGEFEIGLFEKIWIQHVTYIPSVFYADSIQSDTLFLESLELDVGSVVVKSTTKKSRKSTIGNLTKKTNYTINIARNMQIVLYMPPELYSSGHKVSTLRIPLFNRRDIEYSDLLIRPRFYLTSKDNNNPGEEIGKIGETFIVSDENEKYYEIDISKYEVILPDNGFFVGIELIGPVDADGHLIKEIKGAERIDIRGEIKKTSNGYQTMIKINEDRWIDMADYIKGLVPKERFVNVSFGLDILN